MVHFLHLWHFNSQEEVEASGKEFYFSKDKNCFESEINELAERCNTKSSTLNAGPHLL